jgi:hypothetical protein
MDPSIAHEEVLINMYTSNKDVFNRNGETRRSKKRQELRNLTKMSDEQLEGWAVMFGRNVSHLDRSFFLEILCEAMQERAKLLNFND